MNATTRNIFTALVLALFVAGCATTPQQRPLSDEEKQQEIQRLLISAAGEAEAGNHSVALLRYEEALDLNDSSYSALLGAANVAYAMQRYDGALDYYERALQQEPDSLDALEGKALSLLKLQQYASARPLLETVASSDSERWRSLNALGVLADLDSRYALAQTYYRKALALNDDNVRILNNLGYSLIMSREYAEAEAVLQRAVALQADFFRARNNYAIAIAWQKRYEEAVEVLAVDSPYEVAYNNVGYIAYLNNDLDSARFYLKKAITASPTYYPEAARNLEKVEKAMDAIKREGSLR